MTKRINPEGKSARDKIRSVMKETERLIDRLVKDADTVISGEALATQVALNLGLTLQEVKPIVATYTYTRTDLTLKGGWHGNGKSRWYGDGIGKR
jgi:hypothetical protein